MGALDAQAVWIERTPDRTPGTIHVGILAAPADLDGAVLPVERQLRKSGQVLATHFVVHGTTIADLEASDDRAWFDDIMLVYGWLAPAWRAQLAVSPRTHDELDAGALALGQAIADLLPKDSSLLDRAAAWIERRLEHASPAEAHELEAWRSILGSQSLAQVQALLRSPEERATRLLPLQPSPTRVPSSPRLSAPPSASTLHACSSSTRPLRCSSAREGLLITCPCAAGKVAIMASMLHAIGVVGNRTTSRGRRRPPRQHVHQTPAADETVGSKRDRAWIERILTQQRDNVRDARAPEPATSAARAEQRREGTPMNG